MEKDGTQAGPIMQRYVLEDGTEIMLPAGTILYPVVKPKDWKPVDPDDVSLGGTFY